MRVYRPVNYPHNRPPVPRQPAPAAAGVAPTPTRAAVSPQPQQSAFNSALSQLTSLQSRLDTATLNPNEQQNCATAAMSTTPAASTHTQRNQRRGFKKYAQPKKQAAQLATQPRSFVDSLIAAATSDDLDRFESLLKQDKGLSVTSRASRSGASQVRWDDSMGDFLVDYTNGQTPIHAAAGAGAMRVLARCLQQPGVDVDVRDEGMKTPMMVATFYDRPDAVKLLLDHGSKASASHSANWTALHVAAKADSWQCMTLLLEHLQAKADEQTLINQVNQSGDTALSVACKHHAIHCVKLLLKHGANTQHYNHLNRQPLRVAAEELYALTSATKTLDVSTVADQVRDGNSTTSMHQQVQEWTVAQVGVFLRHLNMPHLALVMEQQAVNGRRLLQLGRRTMISQLGITVVAEQNALLSALNILKTHKHVKSQPQPTTVSSSLIANSTIQNYEHRSKLWSSLSTADKVFVVAEAWTAKDSPGAFASELSPELMTYAKQLAIVILMWSSEPATAHVLKQLKDVHLQRVFIRMRGIGRVIDDLHKHELADTQHGDLNLTLSTVAECIIQQPQLAQISLDALTLAKLFHLLLTAGRKATVKHFVTVFTYLATNDARWWTNERIHVWARAVVTAHRVILFDQQTNSDHAQHLLAPLTESLLQAMLAQKRITDIEHCLDGVWAMLHESLRDVDRHIAGTERYSLLLYSYYIWHQVCPNAASGIDQLPASAPTFAAATSGIHPMDSLLQWTDPAADASHTSHQVVLDKNVIANVNALKAQHPILAASLKEAKSRWPQPNPPLSSITLHKDAPPALMAFVGKMKSGELPDDLKPIEHYPRSLPYVTSTDGIYHDLNPANEKPVTPDLINDTPVQRLYSAHLARPIAAATKDFAKLHKHAIDHIIEDMSNEDNNGLGEQLMFIGRLHDVVDLPRRVSLVYSAARSSTTGASRHKEITIYVNLLGMDVDLDEDIDEPEEYGDEGGYGGFYSDDYDDDEDDDDDDGSSSEGSDESEHQHSRSRRPPRPVDHPNWRWCNDCQEWHAPHDNQQHGERSQREHDDDTGVRVIQQHINNFFGSSLRQCNSAESPDACKLTLNTTPLVDLIQALQSITEDLKKVRQLPSNLVPARLIPALYQLLSEQQNRPGATGSPTRAHKLAWLQTLLTLIEAVVTVKIAELEDDLRHSSRLPTGMTGESKIRYWEQFISDFLLKFGQQKDFSQCSAKALTVHYYNLRYRAAIRAKFPTHVNEPPTVTEEQLLSTLRRLAQYSHPPEYQTLLDACQLYVVSTPTTQPLLDLTSDDSKPTKQPPQPVIQPPSPTDILESIMNQVVSAEAPVLRSNLTVKFVGSPGIGAGPIKEFILYTSQLLLGADSLYFKVTPSKTALHIAPTSDSPHNKKYYTLTGRILALAIMHRVTISFTVSRSLLRRCLHSKHDSTIEDDLCDLQEYDNAMYKTFTKMIESCATAEAGSDVAALEGMTFTASDGTLLTKDGANTKVTPANLLQFTRAYINHTMYGDKLPLLHSFVEGFTAILPRKHAQLLTADDLQYMLAGSPVLDVEDLRKHIYMSGSLTESTPVVIWFFQWLKSIASDRVKAAKLCEFWTGSAASIHGFSARHNDGDSWSIDRLSGSSDQLPRSATCSFSLYIPQYTSYEQLAAKFETAINYGSRGFSEA